MRKFKEKYIIGFGHPMIYRSGLSKGIMFYSDTDKRFSNTRDLDWPEDLTLCDRNVPQYQLVLRRIKNSKHKLSKSK